MKNKFLISLMIISIFSIMFLLPLGSSFMPKYTHKLIQEQSLKEPINSEFYKSCLKYPELCYSGNVLSDVSVVFYYTGQGKYTATHSGSFCNELINNIAKIPGKDPEKMRACAIGGCLHQPADIVSHSNLGNKDGMVSYAISHSLLVNSVIHVFAEQKMDNWVERNNPQMAEQSRNYLSSYKECEDLFIVAMMGESDYGDMQKADLENVFEDFINEIITSTETGYNPAFQQKSFLGTLDSLPTVILVIYVLIMLILFLIILLIIIKLLKRNGKIRHILGLVIFLPILIILIYLFIGASQGQAFKNFITLIKPVSELVPIGNNQQYIDDAVLNNRQILTNGQDWLNGKDASGLGAYPVLEVASSKVLIYDYILMILLGTFLIWFIWFLFKKNKILEKGVFNL